MGFAEGFQSGAGAFGGGFRMGLQQVRTTAEMREVMEKRAERIQWQEEMAPKLQEQIQGIQEQRALMQEQLETTRQNFEEGTASKEDMKRAVQEFERFDMQAADQMSEVYANLAASGNRFAMEAGQAGFQALNAAAQRKATMLQQSRQMQEQRAAQERSFEFQEGQQQRELEARSEEAAAGRQFEAQQAEQSREFQAEEREKDRQARQQLTPIQKFELLMSAKKAREQGALSDEELESYLGIPADQLGESLGRFDEQTRKKLQDLRSREKRLTERLEEKGGKDKVLQERLKNIQYEIAKTEELDDARMDAELRMNRMAETEDRPGRSIGRYFREKYEAFKDFTEGRSPREIAGQILKGFAEPPPAPEETATKRAQERVEGKKSSGSGSGGQGKGDGY